MNSHPIKVLLVEDDDLDAAAVSRLAKRSRSPLIELVRVETLKNAISYLCSNQPDVLLLDLSLPDSERLKGLIELRKLKADLPIVVFTGLNDDELAFEALRNGAQDFVNKEQLRIEGSISRSLRYAIERQQLVTKLRSAQNELSNQKSFLESILDTAGEGIFVVDARGRVVLLNPAANEILREIFANDEVVQLFKPAPTVFPYACALRGETIKNFEFTVNDRFCIAAAIPIRDENKLISGATVVFRDITEIKRSENAALIGSKMKSEFLANMSHEIRTPINGIIGMTSLLLDSDLNETQRDRMQTVKNSADGLLTVINDILDFSKIEAGKIDLENIDFSLANLINEIESNFQFAAKNKNISYLREIDPQLPPQFKGDAGRIRQVLINLMGNAIKFTNSGHIKLRVHNLDPTMGGDIRQVLFEVEDTGVGIPEEAMERMFKAFSQADASTARKFGGTGLGLSISKGLVERMGGDIGVRHREAQPGTVFWFKLGLKVGNLCASPNSKFSNRIPEDIFKGNVLVAEDNITNQKVAEAMLEKMGLRVHSVANGREVLDALREFSFDLILMDCQMPDMDGYEDSAIIRGSVNPSIKNVPIIALTAHATSGDREKCLACGMTDYLSKPVYPSELAKKIEPWVMKRMAS